MFWNMPDSGIVDFSEKMPTRGPPKNRPARGYPRAHGHFDTPISEDPDIDYLLLTSLSLVVRILSNCLWQFRISPDL